MIIILHKFKPDTKDDEESELVPINIIETESIPRVKEIIICDDITYRVTEVIYDYDLDKVWVRVKVDDTIMIKLIRTLYHKIQNGHYKTKI